MLLTTLLFMFDKLYIMPGKRFKYRGTALLNSSLIRVMRVLIVVALLWALTLWALF